MKTIVGFGDSFVFGSELKNNRDGSNSWIGQAAKNLGVEYKTYAVPGCGNDAIAQQVYSHFANDSGENTLAVINWTWTSRWDFYIVAHETWITLGPTCVPEKLQNLVDKTQSHRLVDFYKDYANSSLVWNKFRNLQTIHSAQCYLRNKGITSVQTYMDYHLFDTQFHAPYYIRELQKLVEPEMQTFEGESFLDWSRRHGFEITEVGLHPLESAHQAACALWQDQYAKLLSI